MTQKSRRNALKGLALTLPAAWAAPVVKSVVLPAHAQTSGCVAPRGCYRYEGTPIGSIFWPGGAGPENVPYWNTQDDCPQLLEPEGFVPIAVASSRQEAQSLLSCVQRPIVLQTNPALPGDCDFYYCEEND